jgi:hypothetical protein
MQTADSQAASVIMLTSRCEGTAADLPQTRGRFAALLSSGKFGGNLGDLAGTGSFFVCRKSVQLAAVSVPT